jgi:hypothetical protein
MFGKQNIIDKASLAAVKIQSEILCQRIQQAFDTSPAAIAVT